MSLTVFCFSFNKQTNDWDRKSTSTFSLSGGTWFPFSLSYLKTLNLMREKMVPRLLSVSNRLKFSTSSGLKLLTELLPIVSFRKLLKRWVFFCYLLTNVNHLLLHLFFHVQPIKFKNVLGKGKSNHLEPGCKWFLIFFFFYPNRKWIWLERQIAIMMAICCCYIIICTLFNWKKCRNVCKEFKRKVLNGWLVIGFIFVSVLAARK